MNELQKPNDIFVATINAPQASTLDFLQNNINASNTSFLTPDEYKNTPMVQKKYSQDGVFNDDAFNQDYLKAYQNFTNLALAESQQNLDEFLEYSPTDRFKPMSGKMWDPSAAYQKFKNPLQRAFSVEGINYQSDPTISMQEAAQSNYIFDPKIGQFTDKTPESLSLWDKINGQTLIYSQWEDNGTHIDSETGKETYHYKGDFKTDKNGNPYTEYLGDRELGEHQIVNLQDILTNEGSFWNKLDFIDSDGIDKSAFGVAMKTAVTIAPYFIPYIGPYYAGLTTIFGLGSVLPTFYKSMESIIAGDGGTSLSPTATELENWFRKFEASKTPYAQQHFWSLESIGSFAAEIVSQLYQQRAAAEAAKWFVKVPTLSKGATPDQILSYWQAQEKLNTVGKAMNLGYMGLISTSDIYNQALNAGYDKRTAGIASLVSAGALFSIMNFNETANGLGTWFLRNTTGYDHVIESGVNRTVAKEMMNKYAAGVKAFSKGDKRPLINAITEAKNKTLNYLDDAIVIGAEGFWKNAIVEGVEEVTEEVVQDMVKGLADTMSWLGLTEKKGSFGGWSNVFSREGLERYVQTFVGGAAGGALFHGTDKFGRWLEGNPLPRNVNYTLDQAIIDGRTEQVIDQISKVKKFYNTKQQATLGRVGDEDIALSTTGGDSQADVIEKLAINYIRERQALILRETENLPYDYQKMPIYQQTSKALADIEFDKNVVMPEWEELVSNIVSLQKEITAAQKSETESPDLQEKIDQLKSYREQLQEFTNGKKFAEFTRLGMIASNPNLIKELTQLDIESYAQKVFGKSYNSKETSKEIKEQIKKSYDLYKAGLSKTEMRKTLKELDSLLIKTMPLLSDKMNEWIQNEHKKIWLKKIQRDAVNQVADENGYVEGYTGLFKYLQNNPRFWSLQTRLAYKLAETLESKGIIDLSEFNDDQKKIVRLMINDYAATSSANVWTADNLDHLINDVINKALESPENSLYTKYLSEKEEKKKEGDQAMLDIKITKHVKFNKDAVIEPELQNIKLDTILDAILEDDVPYVDSELYEILRQAFNAEQDEALRNKFSEILNRSVGPNTESLIQILTSNTLNGVISYTINGVTYITEPINIDFSGISINNIYDYKQQIQSLLKSLITVHEGVNVPVLNAENLVPVVNPNGETKVLTIEEINGAVLTSVNNNSEYTPDVISDIVSALTEMSELLQNEGILPQELQQKWNKVAVRTQKENPLLSIVKDLMHKIGHNNDDVITWLFNKGMEVQESPEAIGLSQVDLQTIQDFGNVLKFLSACVRMMSSGNDLDPVEMMGMQYSLPYNKALSRYYTLYLNDPETAKLFPSFDDEDLGDLLIVLNGLEHKIAVLQTLNESAIDASLESDKTNQSNYLKRMPTKLQNISISLKGETINLVSKQYDVDVDDPEQYILDQLQAFHERVQSDLKENKYTKQELIQAILSNPNFKAAYKTDQTLSQCLDEKIPDYISGSLLFDVVLSAIAVDQNTLASVYTESLSGKNLLPRFDQELVLKSTVAKLYDSELYEIATAELAKQLEADAANDDSLIKYKNLASRITFISGFTGSGKSVITTAIVDGFKPKKIILTAPTSKKVEDLHNSNFKHPELIDKDQKTFWDLFGDAGKQFKAAVQQSLNNFNTDEKLPGVGINDFNEFKFSTQVKIHGNDQVVNYKLIFKGTRLYGIQITNPEDIESVLLGNPEWTEQFKDAVVVIDEVTNLDQLSILLMNSVGKIAKGVIVMGDGGQIGSFYQQTLKNGATIKHTINVNSFITHRPPVLSGIIRAKNTGKRHNQVEMINPLVQKFVEYTQVYEYNAHEDTEIIDTKFNNQKLKYNGLLGDQVAQSDIEFKNVLTKLAADVNNKSKSLIVIYESESDKNVLKQLMEDVGFNKEIVNDDSIFQTLESAQGAEADYSIIYNLSSDRVPGRDAENADVDMTRMNTAIGRSRDYSIIRETIDNGLFKSYNVQSEIDSSVAEIPVNITPDRLIQRCTILQGKAEKFTRDIQEEPKVEVEEIENEEEAEEPDDSEDSENGDTLEEPEPLPTINIENNEVQEPQKQPLDDKQKELRKKIKDSGFNDAIEVYCYYTRLGITKDALIQLKQASNKAEISKILDTNIDTQEQIKDLPGYWKIFGPSSAEITGEQLLRNFIQFRNEILYNSKSNSKFALLFKRSDETDWPYLKPNEHPERQERNGSLLTTVVKEYKSQNGSIYITMGRVGFNSKTDDDHSYSQTLKDFANRYLKSGDVRQAMVNLTPDRNTLNVRKINYYNGRKIQSSKVKSITENFISELVPITGLVNYRIDSKNENNSNIITSKAHLSFSRMTIGDLKRMGYTVTEVASAKTLTEFAARYNIYRFEDLSNFKKFGNLWTKKWVIITPIGIEANENAYSKLVLVQNALADKTVYKALKTGNDKTLKQFSIRKIFSYLAYKYHYDTSAFNGLDTHFTGENYIRTSAIDDWSAAIDNFISELSKDPSNEKLVENIEQFKKQFFAPYTTGTNKGKGVQSMSLSDLQKLTTLYNVLDAPESKGFAFDYDTDKSIISDDSIVTRVFEAPRALLDFSSMSIGNLDFEFEVTGTGNVEEITQNVGEQPNEQVEQPKPSSNTGPESAIITSLQERGILQEGDDYDEFYNKIQEIAENVGIQITGELDNLKEILKNYRDNSFKLNSEWKNWELEDFNNVINGIINCQ